MPQGSQLAGFRGCRKSEMIWQGSGAGAPVKVLVPWGANPQWRFMVSSDELGGVPVMMVES